MKIVEPGVLVECDDEQFQIDDYVTGSKNCIENEPCNTHFELKTMIPLNSGFKENLVKTTVLSASNFPASYEFSFELKLNKIPEKTEKLMTFGSWSIVLNLSKSEKSKFYVNLIGLSFADAENSKNFQNLGQNQITIGTMHRILFRRKQLISGGLEVCFIDIFIDGVSVVHHETANFGIDSDFFVVSKQAEHLPGVIQNLKFVQVENDFVCQNQMLDENSDNQPKIQEKTCNFTENQFQIYDFTTAETTCSNTASFSMISSRVAKIAKFLPRRGAARRGVRGAPRKPRGAAEFWFSDLTIFEKK